MTVRELVTAFTKSRSMTQIEMAQALGYKSVTSLVRLMNDATASKSVEDFVRRIQESFTLTEAEERALREINEQLGWESGIEPGEEMLHFLRDDLVCEDVKPGIYLRYGNFESLRIVLINAVYAPRGMYRDLERLMYEKGACVDHYICLNDNKARTIRAFTMITQVCFQPNYDVRVYAASISEDRQKAKGVLTGDLMIVQYRDGQGEIREEVVILEDHDAIIMPVPAQTFYNRSILPFHRFRSIKRGYPKDFQAGDYLAYCKRCLDMELGHAEYKIRKDISMSMVHPDILIAAYREGPVAQAAHPPLDEEKLEQIYSMGLSRYQNVQMRRKPLFHVMKQDAMWNFIQTGVLSDHVWMLRPFTVEERIRIMQDLMHAIEQNGSVHVHFLREDLFLSNTHIYLYEGVGLWINRGDMHHDLSGGQSEIVIMDRDFMRIYRDYYIKTLVREHVLTGEQTQKILREMLQKLYRMRDR